MDQRERDVLKSMHLVVQGAEPYPRGGEKPDSARKNRRPAQTHPWRKPFKPQK
jgi:hypothetical protein